MKNRVVGVVYPSETFEWDAESKLLIGNIRKHPAVLRDLFTDSMELGFGIRSRRTQQSAFFSLADIKYTDDRQATPSEWIFEPVPQCVKENPLLDGVRVVIVNNVDKINQNGI